MKSERGILGIKTAIVFVAMAVVLFDLGAIAISRFQIDDWAIKAADVAAQHYRSTGDRQRTEQAVKEMLRPCGCSLESIRYDDRQVFVTLSKRAPTLVAHRVGPLEEHTLVGATHRGRVAF